MFIIVCDYVFFLIFKLRDGASQIKYGIKKILIFVLVAIWAASAALLTRQLIYYIHNIS